MDDAGTLGEATCGCELRWGLSQQVDGIFSYGRLDRSGNLTDGRGCPGHPGEGHAAGAFGGVPSDYQLVEDEGSGQTRDRVEGESSIATVSEDEVKRFFLSQLNQVWGGSTTHRLWTQTGSLRVVFASCVRDRRAKGARLASVGGGEGEAIEIIEARAVIGPGLVFALGSIGARDLISNSVAGSVVGLGMVRVWLWRWALDMCCSMLGPVRVGHGRDLVEWMQAAWAMAGDRDVHGFADPASCFRPDQGPAARDGRPRGDAASDKI